MSKSQKRNFKRLSSIVLTMGLIVATNIAISYAGNNKAGIAILPDSPRPKAGIAILPDSPRPKAGIAILPDSPRPKAGIAILPDSPRP